MRVYGHRILANGLRTDHPIPGLPFVDDSHIPVEDPDAVEAVGRDRGEGMWGRTDRCFLRSDDELIAAGDKAYTTDPSQGDLAWLVRSHPEHGRSVMLVADADASGLYADIRDDLLLWRAGGYWWDGVTWWRPAQLFDMATEDHVKRSVPGAATITAAATLSSQPTGRSAKVLTVNDISVDADSIDLEVWRHHLAAWAEQRPTDSRPLEACVVDVTAPELAGNQLLSLNQMAAVAGISAGTLRGYLSRGENDVPDPQMEIGARSLWSRPVVQEWVETRSYTFEASSDAVSRDFGQTLAGGSTVSLPVGVADLWEKVHYWILSRLSRSPEIKPRFALRWRDQQSLQEVAKDLSWTIAAGLDQIIPMGQLAKTIRDAMLGDVREESESRDSLEQAGIARAEPYRYTLSEQSGVMLDWLIRHEPRLAQRIVQEFVGTVERSNDRYRTSRGKLVWTLTTALSDGKLTREQADDFLNSAIIPLAE